MAMTNAPGDAVTGLLQALARVQRHHIERNASPELAQALAHLAAWQSRRLRNTYADLERSPRYARAMTYFQSDLYGGADFAQRDADLVRVVPAMRRLLPDSAIAAVTLAVDLNALSQDLDLLMTSELGSRATTFSVADYCAAYRRVGRYDLRRQQIDLIAAVGAALDRLVRKPMLRTALGLMRKPASLAGLSALQDFLERGFAAFAEMRGANEFLATIVARETAIRDAIFAGSDAPFPAPF
jgi:hypothetical protein